MATCHPGHHTFPVCSSICCVTSLCFLLYLSPMSCSSSEESHLLPSQIENLDYFCRKARPAPTSNTSHSSRTKGASLRVTCTATSPSRVRSPFQPQAPRPSVLTEGSFPLRQSLAHWAFPMARDMLCLMDSGLSKGSDPFEFCTALDIIPFDKRVFAPDYRSTVGRL